MLARGGGESLSVSWVFARGSGESLLWWVLARGGGESLSVSWVFARGSGEGLLWRVLARGGGEFLSVSWVFARGSGESLLWWVFWCCALRTCMSSCAGGGSLSVCVVVPLVLRTLAAEGSRCACGLVGSGRDLRYMRLPFSVRWIVSVGLSSVLCWLCA